MPELRQEDIPFKIDPKRVTLLVGFAAAFLPVVLVLLSRVTATCDFDSLSHYYYSRFGSDYFVGSLTFIGLLLLFLYVIPKRPAPGTMAFTTFDRWAIKGAGAAAFLIAFFPTSGTGCESLNGQVVRSFVETAPGFAAAYALEEPAVLSLFALLEAAPEARNSNLAFDFWAVDAPAGWLLRNLHNLGALIMFLVLGYISAFVFTRVQSRGARRDGVVPMVDGPDGMMASFWQMTFKKKLRNLIYWLMGIAIFVCIAMLVYKSVWLSCAPGDTTCDPEPLRAWNAQNLTLVYEALALWAFGFSWLVKGRVIKWLNDPEDPA
ncbi:MAG: hypothetical protein QNJ09_11470 [Paracoccaceae bacterium]|nr:hypothetical protein [Paracoccaceae bacterium]